MSAGDLRYREYDWNGYRVAKVGAGVRHVERVVPPAGEEHAFTRISHPLEIEVCTSPTGRSTRLFVNGVEIDWKAIER